MLSTTNPFCLDSRHTVEYLLAALPGGSSKAPSPNGSGDFKEVDKRPGSRVSTTSWQRYEVARDDRKFLC